MTKLRVLMAALVLLCLLPMPTASAGSSCTRHSYGPGRGQIVFSPYENPSKITGNWVDACGGKKCDDHVIGTIHWKDGTSSSFYVDEIAGSNDNCTVRCQIDTAGPYTYSGWVIPSSGNGWKGVDFACGDWFSGHMAFNTEDLSLYVSDVLPSV